MCVYFTYIYIYIYSFHNGDLDVLFEYKVVYEKALKFLNGLRVSLVSLLFLSNFFNCDF